MLFRPLKNNQGVALVFMVLFFAAAATAAVVFISLGVKVKGIQKEGETQTRLSEIMNALQNYYLIHYDLPDASLSIPINSVPTALLNLPQKYRFDSNGQTIYYNRLPASGRMTTVRNTQVHGADPEDLVAAVLVAAGPDKSIDPSNQSPPYGDSVNDDLVLGISLEVEALKIANHTVSVLQQAAKAYDSIFYGKNNDIDTLYSPPETIWVDLTQPTRVRIWQQTGVDGSGNPIYGWVNTGAWHNNYSGDNVTNYVTNDTTSPTGGTTTLTAIPLGDEYVEPFPLDGAYIPPQPESIIDEDGYTPAQGGAGSGCVRIADVTTGILLTNDPDRGVASLDNCSSTTPAYDLAVAYGLNLVKLGYDGASSSLLDPWGNRYVWGAAQNFGTLAATSTSAFDRVRDRHYWTFYSAGPDGLGNTADDILPPADRIFGYYLTPTIPNPIP